MKAWSLSGWILGISEQVKETIGRTVIASDFKVTGSRVCWEESQMSLLKNWAKAGESQVPAPGCQVLSSSWFHSLELLVKWGSERLPRVTHTHAGCAHTWARNTKDAYMHEMCTHAICLLRLMGRDPSTWHWSDPGSPASSPLLLTSSILALLPGVGTGLVLANEIT